jgi:hypothetical protein
MCIEITQLWDIAQARVCEVIVGILCGGMMMMILPSTSDGTTLITALKTMHSRLLEHASLLWQPDTTTTIRLSARKGDRSDSDHEPVTHSGVLEPLPLSSSEMRAEYRCCISSYV